VVLTTTTNQPLTKQPAPTASRATTTTTTAPVTAAPTATSPPTTKGVAGPGEQVVPDVIGLHRQQVSRVMAQAGLGVRFSLAPAPDPGGVQRAIAQQPLAGKVVPAGSDVTVVIGTKGSTNQ
jgi:PASTA domain